MNPPDISTLRAGATDPAPRDPRGEWLRTYFTERRARLGLSQRQLADKAMRLGIPLRRSDIENREYRGVPNAVLNLLAYASALQASGDVLTELMRLALQSDALARAGISEALGRLRRQRGLSQRQVELIPFVCVRRPYVAKLERGGVPESVLSFMRYCYVLSVDLDLIREIALASSSPDVDFAIATQNTQEHLIAQASRVGRVEECLARGYAALAKAADDSHSRATALMTLSIAMSNSRRWRLADFLVGRAQEVARAQGLAQHFAVQKALTLTRLKRPQDAIRLLENGADAQPFSSKQIGMTFHHHLGFALSRAHHYQRAFDELDRSLSIAKQLGALDAVISNITEHMRARSRMGQARAVVRYLEMFDYYSEASAPAVLCYREIEAADALGACGVFSVARRMYSRALERAQVLGHEMLVVRALIGLRVCAVEADRQGEVRSINKRLTSLSRKLYLDADSMRAVASPI